MPIFEYRCVPCGAAFELLLRAGERPCCPKCAGTALEKQLSLPAAPGKSAGIIAGARAQAAREGHFSHYSPAERPRTR